MVLQGEYNAEWREWMGKWCERIKGVGGEAPPSKSESGAPGKMKRSTITEVTEKKGGEIAQRHISRSGQENEKERD
jgi:hypothetical protein